MLKTVPSIMHATVRVYVSSNVTSTQNQARHRGYWPSVEPPHKAVNHVLPRQLC